MTGIAENAPYKWMQANDIPEGIPRDADLYVDEQSNSIVVEVFATDADGRTMTHGQIVMTTLARFPLKVPPPPGMLAAYRHTVRRLRASSDAADTIRRETALRLIDALSLNPIVVFDALGLPASILRLEFVCPLCKAERADYEGPDEYLPGCPNCGTDLAPAVLVPGVCQR